MSANEEIATKTRLHIESCSRKPLTSRDPREIHKMAECNESWGRDEDAERWKNEYIDRLARLRRDPNLKIFYLQALS
jgi:hypothetical protein